MKQSIFIRVMLCLAISSNLACGVQSVGKSEVKAIAREGIAGDVLIATSDKKLGGPCGFGHPIAMQTLVIRGVVTKPVQHFTNTLRDGNNCYPILEETIGIARLISKDMSEVRYFLIGLGELIINKAENRAVLIARDAELTMTTSYSE